MEIQKFGKKMVEDVKEFEIPANYVNGTTLSSLDHQHDKFVPGNFIEIPSEEGNSEASQLAYPSFVEFKSGKAVKISDTSTMVEEGKGVPKTVEYEVLYQRDKFLKKDELPKLPNTLFGQFAETGAAAKSALSQGRTQPSPAAPPLVERRKAKYTVVDAEDLKMIGTEQYDNHVEAYMAQSKLGLGVKQNSLILSTFE